jgi:pseudaminic acid cytidylyltransferase
LNIAIIPARSGSKRIPGKNIKEFCGKPMIGWSILEAINSECFDHIVVSTDSHEIAEIANSFGAETPFLRPKNISDDFTPIVTVMKHAISELLALSYKMTNIFCIFATAPFIRSNYIKSGLHQLTNNGCDYVFPVTTFSYPIQRSLIVNTDNTIRMLYPELSHTRSQDLDEAWHDAGQFYWGKFESWVEEKEIFKSDTQILRLPRKLVQDIDTYEDWEYAEALFNSITQKK